MAFVVGFCLLAFVYWLLYTGFCYWLLLLAFVTGFCTAVIVLLVKADNWMRNVNPAVRS